jgi:DNA primase
MTRVDVAALKAAVPLAELVGRRVELKLRRAGEWIGRCPFHQDRTPSFKVDAKGFYKCFGCDAKGDHLSWLAAAEGLDFQAAVRVLEDLAGGRAPRLAGPARLSPALARGPDPDEAIERRAAALAIWHEARPAAGTDVVRYLASRGIRLVPPETLRWHPGLWHPDAKARLPAMVAAMAAADRRIVAVHRTFLAPGGRGKADVPRAKMMLGQAGGAAIRLAPVGAEGVLGVAEGIETALSVMQLRPDLPVWAAGSLGAIAGGGLAGDRGRPHPTREGVRLPGETPDLDRPGVVLPAEVRHVVILPDADGDRPAQNALIERAIRRWQRGGRRVSVAWPSAGGDWNDELQAAE